MLVLAVAVSHSPAIETTSRPLESWLKKRGCPKQKQDLFIDVHIGSIIVLKVPDRTYHLKNFSILTIESVNESGS